MARLHPELNVRERRLCTPGAELRGQSRRSCILQGTLVQRPDAKPLSMAPGGPLTAERNKKLDFILLSDSDSISWDLLLGFAGSPWGCSLCGLSGKPRLYPHLHPVQRLMPITDVWGQGQAQDRHPKFTVNE